MEVNYGEVRLLEQIANEGVNFTIFRDYTMTGGWCELTLKQLIAYLKNPKEYLIKVGAEEAEVSVERYLQWWNIERKYDGRARCQATRVKRGKRQQCKMGVDLPLPKEFDPSIDLYCRFHTRLKG